MEKLVCKIPRDPVPPVQTDRQKDGQNCQRTESKTKHLNSHGFLEQWVFVAAAEISVSGGVLPDW